MEPGILYRAKRALLLLSYAISQEFEGQLDLPKNQQMASGSNCDVP